jgi:hypothetical protein
MKIEPLLRSIQLRRLLFPPPYIEAEKQVEILKLKCDREFVSYNSDAGANVFKVLFLLKLDHLVQLP